MSRYIEHDYMGSAVAHLPTKILQTEHGIELVVSVTDVIEIIKNAPSIDIVRCGECRAYDSECKWCGGLGLGMNPDDFCSYGERESE